MDVQGSTVYDVVDLGFDPLVARRAVAATNNAGVEQAVDWIFKNAPPAGNVGRSGSQKYGQGYADSRSQVRPQGSGHESGKGSTNTLEFLTHALTQVGFAPTQARKAVLATNMEGVPQAIEWALSHLGDESKPQSAQQHLSSASLPMSSSVPQSPYGGRSAPNHPAPNTEDEERGLVVELPDGKLFKLKHPNGRVVEMPNGSIVEMLDGQIVEMTNGQQLEMVDGTLVEVTGPTIQFDEGEIVGHRIFSLEESRRILASRNNGQSMLHAGSVHASPAHKNSAHVGSDGIAFSVPRGPQDQKEEWLRKHQQVVNREEQVRQQAQQLSSRDQAMRSSEQQLAHHQQSIRAKEEDILRHKSQLQVEQEGIAKQLVHMQGREAELKIREGQADQWKQELQRLRERLQSQENALKDREEKAMAAASAASTVSAGIQQQLDNGDQTDDKSAISNIEAGRIRFSELTLGSLLGSGSFADVYRAEWRMPCAVKKMKGRISKEQMTEFIREGEMMRQLKHPGIVKLLGVSVDSGCFYLVQEVVNGLGNLFDYLHKKKQRLTYWQVVEIGKRVCDAMAYLHSKHIVHRDLKPQNCLLVSEKGDVKLCDFGLARLKKSAFVETVSNTAGTPAYQAPEMLRDEPISEKVDQYGMGIMLWEMFTGNLPWSDKNYHQMIHTVAVRNERPPITADMPRELVQVIESCWHPIPAKRPPFQELRQTFKELQKMVAHLVPPNLSSLPQNLASQNPMPTSAMPSAVSAQPPMRVAANPAGQASALPGQSHQPGLQQYFQQQRGPQPPGLVYGGGYTQGW